MRQLNSITIARELDWLAELIDLQLKLYFNNPADHEDIRAIPPPDLVKDLSPYAGLVRRLELGFVERAALALALAPHIRPQMLDIFFTRNTNFDRGFTEFGGLKGKNHGGFLPTGETLLFILSGNDVNARLEVQDVLLNGPLFRMPPVMKLSAVEGGEPGMSGALLILDEYLQLITSGVSNKPDYTMSFPAKLLVTPMQWEDLVLDDHVMEQVQEIQTWIEHGDLLLSDSGIGKVIKPGYRSLFYGPPGTGKTLTASLLGKVTGLDVYRVDLSMVISKYIGETEKNLAGIFDTGQHKNWILFFDEADALFGKRTATSSSHDRYANQEVAYLLQRIEDYPGVVILASNLKQNLDEAFARRFQSMIYFPMPGYRERLRLWKEIRMASMQAAGDMDWEQLADKYTLSGGAIANVVRYAVLQAIREKRNEITREDIIEGIRREYKKEGKTI